MVSLIPNQVFRIYTMAKLIKRLAWFVFMVAVSNTAFAGSAEKPPIEFNVEWKLSLDAAGKITGLAPIGEKVLPEIRRQLQPIVRGWHFTPGKLNDQPAATETTLRVKVSLDEGALGGYKMRILSARTGVAYRRKVAPKYPEGALRDRREGRIWLRVDYDRRGEVVAISPMEQALQPGVDPSLTQAAMDAVKQWTFEPERVGGYTTPGAVSVPICFSLRSDQGCRWKPLQTPEGMSVSADGSGPISEDSVVSIDMGAANHMP